MFRGVPASALSHCSALGCGIGHNQRCSTWGLTEKGVFSLKTSEPAVNGKNGQTFLSPGKAAGIRPGRRSLAPGRDFSKPGMSAGSRRKKLCRSCRAASDTEGLRCPSGSGGSSGNTAGTGSTGSGGSSGNTAGTGSTGSGGNTGNTAGTGSTGSSGNTAGTGSTGSGGSGGNTAGTGSTGSGGSSGNTAATGSTGSGGSGGSSAAPDAQCAGAGPEATKGRRRRGGDVPGAVRGPRSGQRSRGNRGRFWGRDLGRGGPGGHAVSLVAFRRVKGKSLRLWVKNLR
ncbi:uncharacterized PE-PGRS family protein PE_PGRS20-like [Corvus cornix cornix]|uniref:uncharacterized PE-PGRS family protein PE_PGRS20-like n=1 Tax=Corvus cornix cornix TaxID=932674 RepID=UPI00194F4C10|nr:uncharacterized PE-PGRS family protein PE_PGRS20-like [Corvus cornix cornix]XP_039424877.1 uncharacterized PE-PGRS family protein PE_PGRS20-like [Corvus cornix cornix]